MFKLNGIEISNEEWEKLIKSFENIYFPVYDDLGNISYLRNVPNNDEIIEKLNEMRKEKAL